MSNFINKGYQLLNKFWRHGKIHLSAQFWNFGSTGIKITCVPATRNKPFKWAVHHFYAINCTKTLYHSCSNSRLNFHLPHNLRLTRLNYLVAVRPRTFLTATHNFSSHHPQTDGKNRNRKARLKNSLIQPNVGWIWWTLRPDSTAQKENVTGTVNAGHLSHRQTGDYLQHYKLNHP